MGRDPRRRQQAAARKKARRAKRKESRSHGASELFMGVGRSAIARAPIHECLMASDLFGCGIGYVAIARTLSSHEVAVGFFLVDVQCLGVKDAGFSIRDLADYEEARDRINETSPLIAVAPACARKLVEQAIAYAADLGFAPHEDYRAASAVLGDIDPAECAKKFVFGRQGKPFYISGPYDTEVRRNWILATLQAKCGAGGYDCLVGVGDAPEEDGLPDDFEPEDDEEPESADKQDDRTSS